MGVPFKIKINEYRSCLSEVSFPNRLPVTVYLSVVSVVGFIGNALIMIVYWQSFKPSANRIFVLAMAIEDMTINVITLPLQIITIRYAYNTYSYWLCRGLFAAAALPTQTSGLIIVAVALDRLSRIWWPKKKHINEHQCCVINVVIFIFAHVLFAGFVPVYGIHSYPSHIEGVSVKMCWYDDEYRGTSYSKAHAHVVNVIVLGGLVLMTISYILIGIKLWKRKTPMKKSIPLTAKSFQNCTTEYSLHSKLAGEATVIDEPLENRESMATREGADVQAASGSAHITVVEKDLNQNSNDPSLPSGDPSPSPLTENLDMTVRSHPVDIVENDTAQESPHAHGNSGDEEKILLNKEDGRTSLRIRPLETKRQSLKLTILSHENTKEESVIELDSVSIIELGSLAESDDRLFRNYPREIVNNDLSSQLPFGSAQRNPCPQPVKKTETVSSHTRKIRSRTTITMSVLTFFYVVNWIPHCYVRFTGKYPPNLCPGYTDCGANITAFCLRSIYLNSAVNAFVYSYCSTHFRIELSRMSRRLYRRFSRTL
ncbi:octopamine receptor-like [Littorina saxatilis]|uniref:octopamine receptor-like n=1 Tax=Littorina saxatilis TaxID=31220 RepID=UPI0038B53122